jgi:mono/diheme cytochrome c family protein
LALAIGCCGPVAAQTPSEATAATITGKQESPVITGVEVYRAQYCGVCHTLDAAETRGPFGPTHNRIGTIAAERIADPGYTGNATTAEEYIRESIIDPAVYIVPGSALGRYRMGAYTMLSETELDALVQFLLEQR